MHRQGGHQFLLVFPDGNRRLVPVAWTDAASDGANDRVAHAAHTLAGIADLLQTRTIVDALLRRLETEEEHATEPRLSEEPAPRPERVGGAGGRAAHRGARRAGEELAERGAPADAGAEREDLDARTSYSHRGVVEGFNGKARVITKRAYGFRTYQVMEVALYHALGDLPEPQHTHRFC